MSQNKQSRSRAALADNDIVELYWKRDEQAIDETDFKYRKFLYTIARNILWSKLDAEECLNDTYLGAWNQIPPAKPDPLQAFVAKIMRNTAIDRYRQNTAQKRIPTELTTSLGELDECICVNESLEDTFLVQELARIINKFIQTLDEKDEFVFVCRYYFIDNIDTIAAMLKTSPRTIYRVLSGLRNHLKELLDKEGFTE